MGKISTHPLKKIPSNHLFTCPPVHSRISSSTRRKSGRPTKLKDTNIIHDDNVSLECVMYSDILLFQNIEMRGQPPTSCLPSPLQYEHIIIL